MSQPYPFFLEKKRAVDDEYQKDLARYKQKIEQSKQLLAVRAPEKAQELIIETRIRIVNRDKWEALVADGTIYFDIGVLDLLSHFSDELSLAEVKHDPIHILDFNLAYAVALNGDKSLDLISAYNTLQLTEEQQKYLWESKLIAEQVIFDQILGFMIAHEMSHLVLRHDAKINSLFPDIESWNTENPRWNRIRREIELEADSLAAELCLNALIQPAQLLPWLDLNEIRRRYYGKSAEYPTTSQKLTVINNAYQRTIVKEKMLGELTDFKPLPPHKDVTQGDYHLFRQEFQKVRLYRQNLLLLIDEIVLNLIQNDGSNEDVVGLFIEIVEQQRDLMTGAKDRDAVLKIQTMIPSDASGEVDVNKINVFLKEAGIGPYALQLLKELLSQDEINWDQFGDYIAVLINPPIQFLDGITYEYFMGNSAIRWYPVYFSALQDQLPDNEVKAKSLKPYKVGIPIRNNYPTFEERLDVLQSWDGEY